MKRFPLLTLSQTDEEPKPAVEILSKVVGGKSKQVNSSRSGSCVAKKLTNSTEMANVSVKHTDSLCVHFFHFLMGREQGKKGAVPHTAFRGQYSTSGLLHTWVIHELEVLNLKITYNIWNKTPHGGF